MAYDDKNHYPDKPRPVSREKTNIGRSAGTLEGKKSLKDQALEKLDANYKSMDRLKQERADYLDVYMAKKLGTEVRGRSKVVMSDTQDTIESILPSLMRTFYGGKNVIDIKPRGPGDEIKARLMEEKVNFDIQTQNDGFKLFYTFFKDSLIYKQGVIKYHWDNHVETERMKLEGITGIELEALINSEDTEEILSNTVHIFDKDQNHIKDHKMKEGDDEPLPDDIEPGSHLLHTVEYNMVKERVSKPVLENLPPEEFIYEATAKSVESSFCAHKKKVHKNTLKKYGLKDDEIEAEIDGVENDVEFLRRFEDLGGSAYATTDKDSEHVYVYECYMNDYDEEGNAVPMKVLMFGQRALEEEENSYGRPPFIVGSPILMPHRIVGRGMAELTKEIQYLRTALVRYILDNLYFQNNGMRVVNPHRIDVESMMDGNLPGGIVRTVGDTNPKDAIFNIPYEPLNPQVINMLQYVDGPMSDARTGVTAYSQGMDAKSLNKTATGITQIMNATQARQELMARIYAETSFRDLFKALIKMNLDYLNIPQNIKINDKWEDITRESIDAKYDLSIDVGGATGSKDMAYQQKMQMLQTYGMLSKLVPPQALQQIFNIKNVKNMVRAMWEDLGYRNTDRFVAPDAEMVPNTGLPMPPAMPQLMGGANAGGQGAGAVAGGAPAAGSGRPSAADIAGIAGGAGPPR